jgi:Zn ribbon nucleic-acid-binding protein
MPILGPASNNKPQSTLSTTSNNSSLESGMPEDYINFKPKPITNNHAITVQVPIKQTKYSQCPHCNSNLNSTFYADSSLFLVECPQCKWETAWQEESITTTTNDTTQQQTKTIKIPRFQQEKISDIIESIFLPIIFIMLIGGVLTIFGLLA